MQISAPHVLIVDDDRNARLILRNILVEDGYRVAEAADGKLALDAYARLQPDLVLLDIMMPVMDGLETCGRLREDAERRNVPIIMLTALDDTQSVNQAFEVGASDVISKPYNLAIVRQRLRRLLHSKQLEDAIRRAKREWEATLDAVSEVVLVTDPDSRVVRCNRAASIQLQLAYTQLMGRSLAELFHGTAGPAPEFAEPEAGPVQFARLPGWFHITNYPVLLTEHGQGAVHVLRDVTHTVELEAARQAAVEALRKSERQYRLLAENVGDVVWVMNAARQRFTYVSPSIAQLGHGVEEFLRLAPTELMGEGWSRASARFQRRLREFPKSDSSQHSAISEIQVRRADGLLIWMEASTTIVANDADELEIVGVARDISQRKQAEESLAMQASVLANMAEGVNVSDEESGQILLTNPAFDAMFGYPPGELLGQSVTVLNDLSTGENLALMETLRAAILAQGNWSGEFSNRHKDGTPFTSAARISAATLRGRRCWVSVQTDITERKQTQAWILNAQKLADLGTLAAGVAHEMNSPLQVITGVSQSLQRRLDDNQLAPDYLRRNLDVIHRNGWRCAEIVRSLHTYARVSGGAAAAADLNELVRDTLLLVEHQLRSWSNITVVTDLAADLPPLLCDRNQIVQVLINLMTNARDAMAEGGEIKISTSHEPAAGQVVLQVSDTGAGIPENLRSKIFDPFFTTKPVGKGTGLGLSIVAGIVRAYGGEISLESALGRGTTFLVRFPVARPALPAQQAAGRFDDFAEAQLAVPAAAA
ncbi:MAG: PAS domain S-box protein [Anaerolineales bacterium]|nr:PAS domain S-box protein [Anaerolineales bacterium]